MYIHVPPRTMHMHMHFYSLMCISNDKKVLDPNPCTCTVSTHTCNGHELLFITETSWLNPPCGYI